MIDVYKWVFNPRLELKFGKYYTTKDLLKLNTKWTQNAMKYYKQGNELKNIVKFIINS